MNTATDSIDNGKSEPTGFIIGLGPRRFIVVRSDELHRIEMVDATSIDQLAPNNQIIYEGHPETVIAIEPY